MKKTNLTFLLSSLLWLCSLPAIGDEYSSNPDTTTSSGSDETLTKYVKTLGQYLGYDLETETTPIDAMLSYTLTIAQTGQQLLNVFFAAIPVNAAYDAFTTNTNYQSFNDQANILFSNYHSPNGADVSVTKNFDQQTYQEDPVSQSILNILGTPNNTICTSTDPNECLTQNIVMGTVLQDITDKNGYLPGETMYFSPENNLKFLSQLSVNTLIAPLTYSTSTEESTSTTTGLPATNQQQQALEFIRYVTAAVRPIDTMSQADYSSLWNQAKQSPDGQDQKTIDGINDAKKQLSNYLINLRVFAAQSSVAISNLYGMLAKRMPQATSTDSNGTSTTTSQAFNEFQSATWRLYNPETKSTTDQWVQQINEASSATIQKEIAILLSEINYQLYLNRQQQERILLTDTLSLIQLMGNNKPSTSAMTNTSSNGESTS